MTMYNVQVCLSSSATWYCQRRLGQTETIWSYYLNTKGVFSGERALRRPAPAARARFHCPPQSLQMDTAAGGTPKVDHLLPMV